MTDPRLLPSENSYAALPANSAFARTPRASKNERPAAFYERYDSHTLFYDCFRHHDGNSVLLVGPPPMNLETMVKTARFTAGGKTVKPRFYPSESVAITELADVPAEANWAQMAPAGQLYDMRIQPNSSHDLKGARLLFTMSKDNDLSWIAEWARYYQRVHGTDAVVFFDNNSTRYGMDEIAATLLAVPGIKAAAVQSWPYRYGAPDPAVKLNPFYVQFAQVGAMSVALRRYGALAKGLVNADIDELMHTPKGVSIYDLVAKSRKGLVTMTGQFIEPLPDPGAPTERTHRHFSLRHKDAKTALSRPKKWALDPSRAWVQNPSVHPYMHWIHGRPLFGKTEGPEIFYWHFRGISTNWKDERADYSGIDRNALEPDPIWQDHLAQL